MRLTSARLLTAALATLATTTATVGFSASAQATAAALTADGWKVEQVAFHAAGVAAPAPAKTTPAPAPTTAAPAPTKPPAPAPTTPAPAPTTPAPAPTTPPAPAGAATVVNAGSAPVGSASYAVPAGAIHVAPAGNDAAAGSASAPVKTLAKALTLAPAGGTIVLRAGSYNESVQSFKTVTIQNYPGEAAWLDGSVAVAGWVQDGTTWRKDGWTTRFDSSPTYTPGAPDSSAAGWSFVNTSTALMAAHPDQVFVDGAPLQQVASRAQVTTGTFFLDTATSQLFIGSDPAGHAVAASNQVKAMSLQGANTVIRGIGIRRYAPSVANIGSVTLEAAGIRVENVEIADSATTGIGLLRENATLDRVTVTGSGMLGIHGRYADNATLTRVLSTKNNDERFNTAPVSGGAKFGSSRGVKVSYSSFSGNFGPGFWDDCSVYDTTLVNSVFADNTGNGIFLEISNKALVADNFIARNGADGIKVNNTSNVQIWNNTIHGNTKRPIWLAQDERRNTNPTDQGVDKRQAFPDPGMTWTLSDITIKNNVLVQLGAGGNSMIDNSDYSKQHTAEQMKITLDGNVYQRSSASAPSWLVIWSRGTSPVTFTSVDAFRAGTGQETRGREFVGGTGVTDAKGTPTATLTGVEAATALPLPANVASATGKPAGAVHLGKW